MKLENSKTALDAAEEIIDLDVFAKQSVHLPNEKTRVSYAAGVAWGKKLVGASPIRFVNLLGIENAQKLIDGKSLRFGKTVFSLAKRKCVACVKVGCAKIHGDNLLNDGEWSKRNLALSPLFVVNGETVVISQTCVARYINPVATAENVLGLSEMREALAHVIEYDKRHPYTGKRS